MYFMHARQIKSHDADKPVCFRGGVSFFFVLEKSTRLL